jgi:3-dehydroquinate synthase
MNSALTIVSAKGYDVTIGESPFASLAWLLSDLLKTGNRFCVIMDENTHDNCYRMLCELCPAVESGSKIIISPGEKSKSYNSLAYLTEEMTKMGADRGSIVVNLGGGMISDLGGLAASLFKRGVDFINIPTTLLSMVDASIGGKVGINQYHLKNQVGLFAQPKAVFISPKFLNSLDNSRLKEGLVEACKHGLVHDPEYWLNIIANCPELLNSENLYVEKIIVRSVQIKNEIVNQDIREHGMRKVLNFGHTLGHAFEKVAMDNKETPISHGQAIAIGIVCESYLSSYKAGLPEESLKEITDFFMPLFDPYPISMEMMESLYPAVIQDKKSLSGRTNFTLLKAIGKPILNQEVTKKEMMNSITFYQKLSK